MSNDNNTGNNQSNDDTTKNIGKDVVFIDAYNLIYRAFHGTKAPMKNSEGIPTAAVYTVIKMLRKLPKDFDNLHYALAVFDGGKDNFRKEIDEEYKANRKPMPDDLKIQMPYIKRAFEVLGWPCFQAEKVEADDVIGGLAIRASKKGFNAYIISSDKDFRAIVSDNLSTIDTMHNIVYTPTVVKEKMGVTPENVTAYLALLGDGVDNVIGVAKVGEGTASKLLNEYGSLEGIRKNQDKLKGVAGENIRAAFANGQIDKNMSLIQLKLDVDVQLTGKEMRMKPVDEAGFRALCEELNFNSLLKDMKPASPKP